MRRGEGGEALREKAGMVSHGVVAGVGVLQILTVEVMDGCTRVER